MIPMHSPSTPRPGASLFFHPLPTHPSPTVFWLAEAINTKGIIKSVLRSFDLPLRITEQKQLKDPDKSDLPKAGS